MFVDGRKASARGRGPAAAGHVHLRGGSASGLFSGQRNLARKASLRLVKRRLHECQAKGNGNGKEEAAWLARKGALDAVMKDIEKQYGKGIVTVLGDEASQAKVEVIPTGVHTLDLALGGGIPKGRIVEVYGPESSGKTTLAMHAIAEVQKRGGTAVLVDAEHAFDPVYSQKVGVDSKFSLSRTQARSRACGRPFRPRPSVLTPPSLPRSQSRS